MNGESDASRNYVYLLQWQILYSLIDSVVQFASNDLGVVTLLRSHGDL